ncbi:hypothetical protein OO013_10710 [Mangrovivirga sp. M17]|uniref:Uncharacterized protein n=1 Tax=Mangrovivirga halotolerans TaxID=2993936 RepID=A0ABT3RT70_9BACT|nr:hypothetical protein [Mangrovivirga halotolerans]MCX2744340.1 hypothetical protein [Mangrovivirga halotolerans]
MNNRSLNTFFVVIYWVLILTCLFTLMYSFRINEGQLQYVGISLVSWIMAFLINRFVIKKKENNDQE